MSQIETHGLYPVPAIIWHTAVHSTATRGYLRYMQYIYACYSPLGGRRVTFSLRLLISMSWTLAIVGSIIRSPAIQPLPVGRRRNPLDVTPGPVTGRPPPPPPPVLLLFLALSLARLLLVLYKWMIHALWTSHRPRRGPHSHTAPDITYYASNDNKSTSCSVTPPLSRDRLSIRGPLSYLMNAEMLYTKQRARE